MPGTLIGQKNSPFLGRDVQFTLIGQKNSPFLGRVVRPTYDAADRSVRAKKQKIFNSVISIVSIDVM